MLIYGFHQISKQHETSTLAFFFIWEGPGSDFDLMTGPPSMVFLRPSRHGGIVR
jgi:hypothetical protein